MRKLRKTKHLVIALWNILKQYRVLRRERRTLRNIILEGDLYTFDLKSMVKFEAKIRKQEAIVCDAETSLVSIKTKFLEIWRNH